MEDNKVKKPKKKMKLWKKILIGVVILVVLSAIFGRDKSDENKQANESTAPTQSEQSSVEKDTTTATEEAENVKQEKPIDDGVPQEYKNALKKAEVYSDTMHMSKLGIFEQLTSEYGEQFPEAAAQYAIDNLDADYNQNALLQAELYSDTMFLSKKGLYEQLKSEFGDKFTEEEAKFAVDNLVTDYNRNALEKAKLYVESMSMSKKAIYDQLISEFGEQFTKEQAQYAVDHLE